MSSRVRATLQQQVGHQISQEAGVSGIIKKSAHKSSHKSVHRKSKRKK